MHVRTILSNLAINTVKKIPHSNRQKNISFKPFRSTTGMHASFMFRLLLLRNIHLSQLGFQPAKQ